MESKGKHTLDCFSAEDIENYLPVLRQKWSSGMSNPIYYLRGFFAFLYERQEIRQDLSLVLKVNAASKIKVKTGFEANEIEAILTAIDRSTPLGKRNFAMITLAKLQLLRRDEHAGVIGVEGVDGGNLRIGKGHFHLGAIRTEDLETCTCIGNGIAGLRIHLDDFNEGLEVGVIDEVAVGLTVLGKHRLELSDVHDVRILGAVKIYAQNCLQAPAE